MIGNWQRLMSGLLAGGSFSFSPLYGFRIWRIEDPGCLMVFLAIGFAIRFLNEARLQAELRAAAAEAEIRRRQTRRSPGQLLDQLAASKARRMQT
jgi:hypothetical protein